MKIAITADIHLTNRVDKPERYNALESILKLLETDNIEILIIAGDLFDKNFHNYSDFERLCNKYPKIQIHIIPGNHDAEISEKSIISPNVRIYTLPTVKEIGSNTFLFVPYKDKTKMCEHIMNMESEIKGKEWILIGHGDYYCGTKELNPLEPGTYMPLSRENIAILMPKVVFLGHIHKPVNWSNVYYCGSPCGLDISEVGKRRFLIFDTVDGGVIPTVVTTDVIYFEEKFLIVPSSSEVLLCQQQIAKKIKSWNLDPVDSSKVILRVEAVGYAMDRSAILSVLRESFDKFKYYNNEGPLIDRLSTSNDPQLSTIAERTIKLIGESEWNFGGDEPEVESLKIKALNTVYNT